MGFFDDITTTAGKKWKPGTKSPETKPKGENINAILGSGAQRGFITTLTDLETWTFWFNPSEVDVSGSVDYDMAGPMGMSHAYHQFKNSTNSRVSFELYYNKHMLRQVTSWMSGQGSKEDDSSEVLLAKGSDGVAFLESLRIPELPEEEGPQEAVIGAAPPAVRLHLLNLLEMRCRLRDLTFKFLRTDESGSPIEFKASVVFEEAPVTRLIRSEVRASGFLR